MITALASMAASSSRAWAKGPLLRSGVLWKGPSVGYAGVPPKAGEAIRLQAGATVAITSVGFGADLHAGPVTVRSGAVYFLLAWPTKRSYTTSAMASPPSR